MERQMRCGLERLIALAAFAFVGAAPAAAFYCGAAMVLVGQTQADVLQKCGEPAYASGRVETRPGAGWSPWLSDHPLPGYSGLYYGASPFAPAVVEEWIYNFGPTKMMPRLVFENGVLTTIRYHGYGR